MDRDNFFDNLRSENDELIRAQRQLGFEERCIKRVFSECGIKINGWGRFVNECREATGHDRLTFEWFNQRFRSFPGVLSGKRIPRLHELTMLDLFKPAEKNRLGKAVMRGLTNFCATNFVFMFPVTRTMFVAHDHEPSSTDERVVWSCFADPPLFVEPSKHFFRAIGGDWFEG
jgi:hypothetical protein